MGEREHAAKLNRPGKSNMSPTMHTGDKSGTHKSTFHTSWQGKTKGATKHIKQK